MTDLEGRLRDSLADRAEEAPRPAGLALRARTRFERRRAAVIKMVGGVAAVVVVAAAVPLVGAAVEGFDASRSTPPDVPERPFVVPDLSPQVRTARDTMNEVTWSGIRFAVPPEWKPGATTAWCAKAEEPGRAVPRVDLPDQDRSETTCTPTSGYGVRVTPAAGFEPVYSSREVWEYDSDESGGPAAYPDGAWVSYWFDDDWVVTTATPDPGLTSRITRSVRGDEVDVNGCAVTYDAEVLSAVGARGVGAALCRYSPSGPLEDSQRLTERETSSALAALAEAPEGLAPDGCEQEEGWLVTLTPAGQAPYLARYGTQGLGSCQDGVESSAPKLLVSRGHLELTQELVKALDLDDLPVD